MAERRISSFRLDHEGHWVAELECGHPQHVRHRPPWELRPWVTSERGRSEHVGLPLDCNFCDMPELPADAVAYDRTREFSETTIPPALLREHRTKPGTWARIVLLEGRLAYRSLGPEPREWVLRPDIVGTIAPELPHRIEPLGAVRFYIELLRR